MSANGLTVGKDITLNVHTPDGELNIPIETKTFSAKPEGTIQKSVLINSTRTMYAEPTGYSGTFELDRRSNLVESFWAAYDAGWLAGRNIQPSTISITITEADGSVTQEQYLGVALLVENFGTFSGEGYVTQSISWQAANFKKR
jgi:hypothetical protein